VCNCAVKAHHLRHAVKIFLLQLSGAGAGWGGGGLAMALNNDFSPPKKWQQFWHASQVIFAANFLATPMSSDEEEDVVFGQACDPCTSVPCVTTRKDDTADAGTAVAGTEDVGTARRAAKLARRKERALRKEHRETLRQQKAKQRAERCRKAQDCSKEALVDMPSRLEECVPHKPTGSDSDAVAQSASASTLIDLALRGGDVWTKTFTLQLLVSSLPQAHRELCSVGASGHIKGYVSASMTQPFCYMSASTSRTELEANVRRLHRTLKVATSNDMPEAEFVSRTFAEFESSVATIRGKDVDVWSFVESISPFQPRACRESTASRRNADAIPPSQRMQSDCVNTSAATMPIETAGAATTIATPATGARAAIGYDDAPTKSPHTGIGRRLQFVLPTSLDVGRCVTDGIASGLSAAALFRNRVSNRSIQCLHLSQAGCGALSVGTLSIPTCESMKVDAAIQPQPPQAPTLKPCIRHMGGAASATKTSPRGVKVHFDAAVIDLCNDEEGAPTSGRSDSNCPDTSSSKPKRQRTPVCGGDLDVEVDTAAVSVSPHELTGGKCRDEVMATAIWERSVELQLKAIADSIAALGACIQQRRQCT
jgi:hypothetical protein